MEHERTRKYNPLDNDKTEKPTRTRDQQQKGERMLSYAVRNPQTLRISGPCSVGVIYYIDTGM
jgi:hypothetical protein